MNQLYNLAHGCIENVWLWQHGTSTVSCCNLIVTFLGRCTLNTAEGTVWSAQLLYTYSKDLTIHIRWALVWTACWLENTMLPNVIKSLGLTFCPLAMWMFIEYVAWMVLLIGLSTPNLSILNLNALKAEFSTFYAKLILKSIPNGSHTFSCRFFSSHDVTVHKQLQVSLLHETSQ